MADSGRHDQGATNETELTQDEVNDLPGDERDTGWDADQEYDRVR